jgi:hypothetical protein
MPWMILLIIPATPLMAPSMTSPIVCQIFLAVSFSPFHRPDQADLRALANLSYV